jgi:hypothetical protein
MVLIILIIKNSKTKTNKNKTFPLSTHEIGFLEFGKELCGNEIQELVIVIVTPPPPY